MTRKRYRAGRGYKAPANPERYKAMQELRRSSAATPQESRNKRLNTDEAILRNILHEYEGGNEDLDYFSTPQQDQRVTPEAPYTTETP